ncbi:hypothetical protein [Pseudoduganella sp. RAF53_2]|uniref:hypothetical protein n=1 Tax=unclassified Pseudoduganella TaxID=2637179 RepID=UPI003F9BB4F5
MAILPDISRVMTACADESAPRFLREPLSGPRYDSADALARDHADRLVRTFGGEKKLQKKLRQQHIVARKLPSALRLVYSPILHNATDKNAANAPAGRDR